MTETYQPPAAVAPPPPPPADAELWGRPVQPAERAWRGRARRVVGAVRGSAETAADAVMVRLAQLVRLAFIVIEGTIAVRVLFKALGANPDAGFDRALYGFTDPLVRGFRPIFADGTVNGHPFETGSVVALAFYMVAAWLIMRVARILLKGSG